MCIRDSINAEYMGKSQMTANSIKVCEVQKKLSLKIGQKLHPPNRQKTVFKHIRKIWKKKIRSISESIEFVILDREIYSHMIDKLTKDNINLRIGIDEITPVLEYLRRHSIEIDKLYDEIMSTRKKANRDLKKDKDIIQQKQTVLHTATEKKRTISLRLQRQIVALSSESEKKSTSNNRAQGKAKTPQETPRENRVDGRTDYSTFHQYSRI
eukprot:TRINITY_DN12732_c0_g1_i5.p1 TRINITY_DN12732_c0_g1~~TRINITY_DN12732_c0_g1_i5.p1  ORF type:complete len:211 (-),score=32.36 TRINITY_DN12732_c0_g1_i5:628-1260(-)